MKFWPRTLFGRLSIWLLIMVAVGQALSYAIMDRYRDQSSAEQLARLIDAQIHAAVVLLAVLPYQEAVHRYSDTNADSAQLQANNVVRPTLITPQRDFLRQVERRLQQRVEPQYEPKLFISREPQRALWVRFDTPEARWWLVFKRVPASTSMSWQWWALLGLALVIALGATAWISWHVTAPLARLVQGLRNLGDGKAPSPLALRGPDDVRMLTREFNRLLAQLSAFESERRELLAGVSHDLRAPLTRMRLRAEFLEPITEQAAWLRDLQSLESIIDQFLSYVREGEEEAWQTLSLASVVGPLAEHYQQLNHPVYFKAASAPALLLRPLALERLLVNLLENALEYGAPPIEIELQLGANAEQSLQVRDHGSGIDPQAMSNALSPYVRLAADRGGAGHCGLGLAIVSRIARGLNAQLNLQNAPGGGLVVTLTWPAPSLRAAPVPRTPYFAARRAPQANPEFSTRNPD